MKINDVGSGNAPPNGVARMKLCELSGSTQRQSHITICGCSSIGRAPAFQAGCCEFESR